jgi:hypothetical protein
MTCHVVGRGRDRHRVCAATTPIVVTTEAPRPGVLIVHQDGRTVVGRPRSEDRLTDLRPDRR